MEMSRGRPGQIELIEMPGQMELNEGRGIVQIGLEEDQRLAEKNPSPTMRQDKWTACGSRNGAGHGINGVVNTDFKI